jgi:hypothetical protein
MERFILIKIQEKFSLCRDPNAIELPLAFTNQIWGKRPIDTLVCPLYLESKQSDNDVTRIARQIVIMMPCWLVYGNTMNIVNDVRELLNMRNEIFIPA